MEKQIINDPNRGSWTSASNAQADALCPARHLMQVGIPEERSEDASFGTAIHEALLTGDESKLDPQQQGILESAKAVEEKLLVAYFGPEVAGLKGTPVRERRFWIEWADGLRHSGQADVLYRFKSKALIIDLKSLRGEVAESPTNQQLRDLAVLVDWNVPLLTEVAVAINQPLVTRNPQLCSYTKADIETSRGLMYGRVKASNTEGQTPVAGSVQCKWCKAKGVCLAYAKFGAQLVPLAKSIVDVPVSQWTPEQRQQFCDQFDAAQKWLDNAWLAMERGAASDPNFVPNYQMVDGTPRSKIKNLQSVFDRFSKSGGGLQEFMSCASITKTDLTAITRSATKLKGKKLEEAVESIIGDDVEYSAVKKSLKKIKQ